MTEYLQDTNNYLKNHLEYDCADVPEEDICVLIDMLNHLIKVLNKLKILQKISIFFDFFLHINS